MGSVPTASPLPSLLHALNSAIKLNPQRKRSEEKLFSGRRESDARKPRRLPMSCAVSASAEITRKANFHWEGAGARWGYRDTRLPAAWPQPFHPSFRRTQPGQLQAIGLRLLLGAPSQYFTQIESPVVSELNSVTPLVPLINVTVVGLML